jgi:hypothetical protein
MTGVNYLTDEKGKKIAVQIDLVNHAAVWEDFYDCLVAEQRKTEPRMSWETAKNKLNKKHGLK